MWLNVLPFYVQFQDSELRKAPSDDATEEKEGAAPQRLTIAEHADMVTSDLLSREPYMSASLSVVVVGASGDLAKKKTYPALLGEFEVRKLSPRHRSEGTGVLHQPSLGLISIPVASYQLVCPLV